MLTRTKINISSLCSLGLLGLTTSFTTSASDSGVSPQVNNGKPVVYQVFTRLFGNTKQANIAWGTLEQNGVGKFDDFNDKALTELREMGVSHVWYTGVLHHALVTDYSQYGIPSDDPDVVKGRAGSPYAVKDYYNVNPDLANDPKNRLGEFEALIERTHKHGMRVIIDIVPNHVARNYQSLSAPEGVLDFGANDDTSLEYVRDNNFYYVPGIPFSVPQWQDGYAPLGGEEHPQSDGKFAENPAKWTGNGARSPKPHMHDWYETVKVNYGVKPDGTYDFPILPDSYAQLPVEAHAEFWKGKDVPDSWKKFKHITQYWLEKGVDGFRYDMAEMVPVSFWSYLNSAIKQTNPDAFLLAEVYQPALYRDYLHKGKMDYLYDKVGFYDTLKSIMQAKGKVSTLLDVHAEVSDIAGSMLHFLENHDEQRIASPEFAGSPIPGKPAMAVSALISSSPIMLYFGQDVGEDGSEDMGFGDPSRTTIFDYAGVPAHQRWMNGGKFDGGLLSDEEKSLRNFYVDLLKLAGSNRVVNGQLIPLHESNLLNQSAYSEKQLAFVRHLNDKALLVVLNFASTPIEGVKVSIPKRVLNVVSEGKLHSLIPQNQLVSFVQGNESAHMTLDMDAYSTFVFELDVEQK